MLSFSQQAVTLIQGFRLLLRGECVAPGWQKVPL
jgi:hypothetical protein